RTPNGKQRYWCHDCQRSRRDNPQPAGYTEAGRDTILRAYEERSSLRGLERTFGVSRKTVLPGFLTDEEMR
ncbi:MAG: IS1 family transposase, partial [Pyrinomonadaceae bacterium]|nr:IS1 family transposase [Pyrinomonadaceae bacterium]